MKKKFVVLCFIERGKLCNEALKIIGYNNHSSYLRPSFLTPLICVTFHAQVDL